MGTEPRSNRITFLSPPGNGKGKRVLKLLLRDTDFCEENEVSVVLSDHGPRRFYDEHGIASVVADNPSDPVDAVREVADPPDYLVACGWSSILEPETLRLPREAALNCHSSYLPDYKGHSVYRVQWAHAEEYGGATVHHMTEEPDEGRIVAAQRFHIGLFDTPFDIMTRYTELTAALVREAVLRDQAGYEGQEHHGGRYYSKISWKQTVGYGLVNHLLRAAGSDRRLEIPPGNAT